MPVKKRQAKVREFKVTQRAAEAYRAGDLAALASETIWRPWWPWPLPAEGEACPWPPGSAGFDFWGDAMELRRQLEEALNSANQGAAG